MLANQRTCPEIEFQIHKTNPTEAPIPSRKIYFHFYVSTGIYKSYKGSRDTLKRKTSYNLKLIPTKMLVTF